MRQTLCDRCGLPITEHDEVDNSFIMDDREMVRVVVATGWYSPLEDAPAREFHKDCARTLTVAEVYARSGLLPL